MTNTLHPPPGPRIVIVGSTAAGKTTLGRHLAARLGLPFVELDALAWDPGWTRAPDDLLRARVAEALASDTWIVDGNWHAARDLVWPRATTLIWLDYSLPRILWRLSTRTARRLRSREELFNGNREEWRMHFLSRDSLFIWAVTSYGRRRREFFRLLRRPEFEHVKVVHARRPRDIEHWLQSLPGR